MGMEIGAMKQFVESVRSGSVTAAAEKLHLVQSTVSLSIQNLEKELNTRLLYRGRQGVTPTPAGQLLYEGCVDVLSQIDRLKREIAAETWGPLQIGSLESIAVTRLAPFLVRYRKRHAQVSMNLMTADHTLLASALQARTLDLALITAPEKSLTCIPLFQEEVGIVSPEEMAPESLKDLKNSPFLVLPEGCSFRKRLEKIVLTQKLNIEKMEVTSIGGVLACVTAGMGHALITRTYYQSFSSHKQLNFFPLKGESMQVYLAYRKDKWKDLSFHAFEKEILATLH